MCRSPHPISSSYRSSPSLLRVARTVGNKLRLRNASHRAPREFLYALASSLIYKMRAGIPQKRKSSRRQPQFAPRSRSESRDLEPRSSRRRRYLEVKKREEARRPRSAREGRGIENAPVAARRRRSSSSDAPDQQKKKVRQKRRRKRELPYRSLSLSLSDLSPRETKTREVNVARDGAPRDG